MINLENLPSCPICASEPGYIMGFGESGGEKHWWVGISCKYHIPFFSGTIIEFPPDTDIPNDKLEVSVERYKSIIQKMYVEGLGVAERKYQDLLDISE